MSMHIYDTYVLCVVGGDDTYRNAVRHLHMNIYACVVLGGEGVWGQGGRKEGGGGSKMR